MAMGALRALREHELTPGVDIDFVSGDDFATTRAMWPGLYVNQNTTLRARIPMQEP